MTSNNQDTASKEANNPSTDGNNNNETCRRNNNNNSSRRQQNTIQLTNPRNYEGSIADVGAILALKHEKLDKKVQYQVFTEKIGNYVYSNIKNRGDLIPLFSNPKNPMDTFNIKRKSSALTETQLKYPLQIDIYKESIKCMSPVDPFSSATLKILRHYLGTM